MDAGLSKRQWQLNPTPLSRITLLRTYNVFDTTRDVLWIVSFGYFFILLFPLLPPISLFVLSVRPRGIRAYIRLKKKKKNR
jgi:hypothetical protein